MSGFAERLLDWWADHGRHDLPWQHPREPYRVWVAEIMLQQTRVAAVVPYFERFMARFPTLADLAAAGQDDVLALWSGLGYYARARNLHRAARVVVEEHGGELPDDRPTLETLPGLGRSTAAAVAAPAAGTGATSPFASHRESPLEMIGCLQASGISPQGAGPLCPNSAASCRRSRCPRPRRSAGCFRFRRPAAWPS